MIARIQAWLRRVPSADPFEQKSAATIQLFCIGLSVLLAVNEILRMSHAAPPQDAGGPYGVFADWATVAASLGAVWLIRRGRIQPGFRLVLGSYIAILALSLVIRGLAYHEHLLVRVYWVLLVLPALLLGRRALWASLALLLAAMLVGYLRDLRMLGGAGPVVPPVPPLGVWGQAIAVMLLLCVVLDRFGASLREAYAAALAGQREAVEARERLEVEMERRMKVEALLFQSQKLEAVGRLSGGIAHDFNNVLTAIIGFAEFSKESVTQKDPMRRNLDSITDAARRAAGLTQQLLAFARRQIVAPRSVLIEGRVRELEPMLRRLLGEHMRIELQLAADPRPVFIDPIQLDQVLVNLAVNARDAMTTGGTLTIETGAYQVSPGDPRVTLGQEPGECVRLTMRDTGAGMDAATLANIFEPFFTTKEHGRGTGLGLATCYGIVRQAGGTITAVSTPGNGATFEILLPRANAEVEPEPVYQPARIEGGTETVLVVEDEPQILELVARGLRARGYTVLTAATAAAARAQHTIHGGEIALLLTDVVLPGSDGRQLAEELRRPHPGLATLFMSGYSDDVITRHGIPEPGLALISKPFTPDALAAKVREVLDAAQPPHRTLFAGSGE